jgi:hypothetical protein
MDEAAALPAVTPAEPFDGDQLARSRGYDPARVRAAVQRLERGQLAISGVAAVAVVGGGLLAFSPWWTTFYPTDALIRDLVLGALRGVLTMVLTLRLAMFLVRAIPRPWFIPAAVFPVAFIAVTLITQFLFPARDLILTFGVLGGVALGGYLFGMQDQGPGRVFDRPTPLTDARLAVIAGIPEHINVTSGRARWLLFEHAAHTVSFIVLAYFVLAGEWLIAVAVALAALSAVGRWWAISRKSFGWFIAVTSGEALLGAGIAAIVVSQVAVTMLSVVVSHA